MKTAWAVVGVEPTTFRTAGVKSIKTNALTNSATVTEKTEKNKNKKNRKNNLIYLN